MRRRLLYFLIGGLLYIGLSSLFFYHVKVMADELEGEAFEIIDEENGRLSSLENIDEDPEPVLSDTIEYIRSSEDSEPEETIVEDPEPESVETGDVMADDQFKIMIIFSLGLLLGSLLGHNLTGFIR